MEFGFDCPCHQETFFFFFFQIGQIPFVRVWQVGGASVKVPSASQFKQLGGLERKAIRLSLPGHYSQFFVRLAELAHHYRSIFAPL